MNSYLVDPASGICLFQRLSHACLSMRWSKVKPRIAHYNSRCFLDLFSTWITVVILELIHAIKPWTYVTGAFIRTKPSGFAVLWWLWITELIARACPGDISFKCLPYQVSLAVYVTAKPVTGNGGSGSDSGEGAWETATTSKEGSRRANYPLLEQGGSDEKYQGQAHWAWPLEWEQSKSFNEDLVEGKSGASSRGNSSSASVFLYCCV